MGSDAQTAGPPAPAAGEPRLPTFLIVGAAKCGTTSLAGHLARHPAVFVPPAKELYFFERDELWAKGAEWYAAQFAEAGDATAVGEATPSYMFYPWAVDRIAQLLGHVRCIVCLRDPVDRAYSHYLHWRDRMPFEPRSFARAMNDELAAGGNEVAPHRHRTSPPYFGYLARGLYLPQLERLAETFGRQNLHVILLEDLHADPRGTMAAACRFLGVDDGFAVPDPQARENPYRPHRVRWLWRWMSRHRILQRLPRRVAKFLATKVMPPRERPVPPMDPRVRARLEEHFAAPNSALAEWLGRDLGWGRQARVTQSSARARPHDGPAAIPSERATLADAADPRERRSRADGPSR